MHALIQGLILGILTGGVYALMASGQTLIFGIMKVVNLAQGAMVILGAYLAYQLFTSFGIDPFLAIPITTVVDVRARGRRPARRSCGRCAARTGRSSACSSRSRSRCCIEGVMSVTWKTDVPQHQHQLRQLQLDRLRLPDHASCGCWAFVLSLVALGLLSCCCNRTRFGRAVRATVQNPESARLLGVESERVSALGFGLGAATAAAAGSVYGLLYPFNSGSHYDLISRLLSIVAARRARQHRRSGRRRAVIVSTSSAVVAVDDLAAAGRR